MADTGDATAEVQAHESTWRGFKTMMTWGTLGAFLVAALVVFLIAS